jgi:hypothetical protein
MPRRYEVDPQGPFFLADSDFSVLTPYRQSLAESLHSITPTNYAYLPGNVLRYGADPTGAASSQAAFDTALTVAAETAANGTPGIIDIPAGDFKVNWLIQDKDYIWIKTAGFRTRLLPVSSASPVVDIFGSTGGNGVTGLRFESVLIDSQLSGVGTHTGIGFRMRATSPGFIWRSKVAHIYVRGFQDNIVIDCNINNGEIFNNDFDQLDSMDASRYSVYTLGIYNRFGRIFSFHCGQYALYNQASYTDFGNLDSDGAIVWGGTFSRINQIVTENIWGSGAAAALDINNAGHQFGNVVLREVPAAKCPLGISFGALATSQVVGEMTVTGASFPTTPISLVAGSGGVVTGDMTISGGTKISTSTSVVSNWRFYGANISSAFSGDRYVDVNTLIENSGRLRQLAGGRTEKRVGLTYGASIATDASLGSHFTITVSSAAAFTISTPSNAQDGAMLEYTIYNSSGGAMGVISWAAVFKMSAWTNPANGFNRSIRFRNDGSFWTQVSQTGADVPN